MPKGILTAGKKEDFDSLCRRLNIPVRNDYESDREYERARKEEKI